VDLNRTGTPLLEIVSHPHLSSPEEAIAYLDEVRLLLRELGVSDCEMQEGSLRCDANVNVHVPDPSEPKGYAATPLVEIKNLNSFRGVGRAIKYEAERQFAEYQKNPQGYRIEKFLKTTAGWDDAKGRTEVQRHKEEAADYRYFPEPDLVPVTVTPEQVEKVRAEMGERPAEQRQRLETQYKLTQLTASVLAAKGRKLVGYFEAVAGHLGGDGKQAADRLSDLVYPALSERGEEIDAFPLSATAFADFVSKTASIAQDPRRKTFARMLADNLSVADALAAEGVRTDFDEAGLRAAVASAIQADPKTLADYKSGKSAAANKFIGAVMKSNKGAPNELVRRLLEEELAKV
jgi:aspartyl-tRNA(Asn)/glutamyl-tRNA(Gln) amidotransferase subunit B